MNDEFDESENGQAVDSENETTESAETGKEEKSISADLIRGHINTIILRSLSDSDKYGYEIIAEIEKKSCGQYSLKQPSLYSALKRLESQGFVTSYWGGTAGGGRRKYFSLTEDGKKIADQNRSEWEYSRTIIDSLISDK
ncbi:MAG: PadR family transcriptional regulator, partial [Clostridia bacterium]|nr:PadR family transcriptional regulator [Clostridia bacterium]